MTDPKKFQFESILQKITSADARLPPLWQVIYNEAVRGHHLLFDSQISLYEQSQPQSLAPEQVETLCDLALRLLNCYDLSSMRKIINDADQLARCQLFALYCHFVEAWRVHLKIQSN